uniref:(northern house mosquito) hypothetical protein n=1 Tax=Culex pipiens TaxID=7175 RepID=A0A8D8B337_CULPI
MWSAALCTLGVSKPIWGCNCLNFRQGMNSESRGKRPLKIWDSWRNVRKGLVVGSFEELIVRDLRPRLPPSRTRFLRQILSVNLGLCGPDRVHPSRHCQGRW